MSARADECLVVEDAKLGIEAAKGAGMKVIRYMTPNSGDQDLARAGTVIHGFSKLSAEEMLA